MEGLIPTVWLGTVQLLGAVQGLFLVAVLVGSKINQTANRVLAAAMAAWSVELITAWYLTSGLDLQYPHFLGADYLLPFLYGPAFLTYARSVSLGGSRLSKGTRWHFLPLLILALAFTPFYLQSGAAKIALRLDPSVSAWTPWLTGINYIKIVYSLVYLALTFRMLARHRRSIRSQYSSEQHVALLWLRNMLIGGVGMWALSAVVFGIWVASGAKDPIEGFDDVVSIGLVIFVYALGYQGLRQRRVAPGPAPKTYARTGLAEETVSKVQDRLNEVMDNDGLFRTPELTLGQLAGHLEVSSHNLSEVLNTHLQTSFYEYVNSLRVDEVKRRIDLGHDAQLTLLAIALESGFSSKSSFNATFRRLAGLTPTEYKHSRPSRVSTS